MLPHVLLLQIKQNAQMMNIDSVVQCACLIYLSIYAIDLIEKMIYEHSEDIIMEEIPSREDEEDFSLAESNFEKYKALFFANNNKNG